MRILICDDDTLIIEQLQKYIESYFESNHLKCPELVSFTSGESLLADKNEKDIVFLDIEMPGMNGLELLRRLRQEPRWQQLSVVMLTAHEAGPVSQQALDMGAQAYLTKPYSPQQLLAQVKRYAAAVVD